MNQLTATLPGNIIAPQAVPPLTRGCLHSSAVCLGDPTCTEDSPELCCEPQSDGLQRWFDAIYPPSPLRPDVLLPRWLHNANLTKDADVITVWCSFDSIDLPLYMAKLSCAIDFWGRFDNNGRFAVDTASKPSAASSVSLVLALGSTKVELRHGDIATEVEVNLALGQWWRRPKQVNIEYYPDVRLPFQLLYAAWWWNNDTGKVVAGVEPPVVVQLDFNYMPQYLVDNTVCNSTLYADGSAWYFMNGFVQLSKSAKTGVDTLNACMWFLAALTCAMSIVWCMLGKPQDHFHFDLTCFSAALLFALPTMRGLLPALPLAGTRFDVLNMFNQLWLIAFSILLQTGKMVFAVVREERRREPAAAAPPHGPAAAPVQGPAAAPVQGLVAAPVQGVAPAPLQGLAAAKESVMSGWICKITGLICKLWLWLEAMLARCRTN